MVIETPRLTLRPTSAADASRAVAIRQNWHVSRNLSRTVFPPDAARMAAWFDTHEAEWKAGAAYRFAIERDGRMIGITDISDITDREGELGYWLDEAEWSNGFGSEAARALVTFAFGAGDLRALRAGHAADNPASGRILSKLGFGHLGDVTIQSLPRGTEIVQRRYRLERSAA